MHPLECRRLLPQDLKPLNTLSDYTSQGGGQAIKKAFVPCSGYSVLPGDWQKH